MLAQYVRIDDLHIRGALQKKKETQPDDLRPVIAHLCLHAVKTNSVVDVKYLQNIRKAFQLTDPADDGHYFVKLSLGDPLQAQITHCLVFSQSEGIVLMTVCTTSMQNNI